MNIIDIIIIIIVLILFISAVVKIYKNHHCIKGGGACSACYLKHTCSNANLPQRQKPY